MQFSYWTILLHISKVKRRFKFNVAKYTLYVDVVNALNLLDLHVKVLFLCCFKISISSVNGNTITHTQQFMKANAQFTSMYVVEVCMDKLT